jgi:antitoxin (DNA-binding transcriptional repressor) of toxin-antitoxin stability system
MQTASVSELESHLTRYLSSVKAGEEVVVVEGGQAIARVVPYDTAGATGPATEGLDEIDRTQVIRPPAAALPGDFWNRSRVDDQKGSAVAALLEEREDGW